MNTVCLCVGSMCPRGNSRRQDGCDSANDSFQVLVVGNADFRCWLHLHCLTVQRDLPRNRAQRPLSTEGDVEKRTWWCSVCDGHHAHIGTQRGGSTHVLHMKTSVRFQAVGVACSWTLTECFFFFNLVFRKHVKSQMITNEGGKSISRNLFIRKRSGRFPTQTQRCW